MKIVHVNDVVYGYATGDPSARGGAERYGWYLMRALASAGWSVTVGVRSGLREEEVRVVDGVRFLGLSRRTHLLFEWYRFLEKERPDWCFWQCADHLLGPTSEIARWFGVRTAFSMMHDNHVQLRKALSRRQYLWPLYAWGLHRSDVIFIQHEDQRVHLPMRWQRQAHLLPGIVSLPAAIVPQSERNGAVVWVAVIRPAKRPDLLVEIARQLPSIRFIVCGSPNLGLWDAETIERIMTELRSLPNIDYRGHVAPEQALKFIGEANLLLSTSDGEGFPSVFLEAWAAGTPIVSLQIDPDHKIRKGDLGKVTDTVEGAATAIGSFMASPERLWEMGMKARRHVEELHSPMAAVLAFEAAVTQSLKFDRGRIDPTGDSVR